MRDQSGGMVKIDIWSSRIRRPITMAREIVRAVRHRRYFEKRFGALRQEVYQRLYPKDAVPVVLTGPFRGTRYLRKGVWGSITPKWLGSYEAELHPAIGRLLPFSQLINLGAAEGYYAIGLAKLVPACCVKAFDIDFLARQQLRRLARLNQVSERVEVSGRCDVKTLKRLLGARTLLLCDIEGSELALLDPALVPEFRDVEMLVELHDGDGRRGDVETILGGRFAGSHDAATLHATERSRWVSEHGASLPLDPALLKLAVDEHRSDGSAWLWLKPRSAQNESALT